MNMKDMKIGIVGAGTVGKATAHAYLGYVKEVRIYDVDKKKTLCTINDLLHCDLNFVCLHEGNLETFFETVSHIRDSARPLKWVIRSTTSIGQTRELAEKFNLQVAHSPEFLTERTALTEALMPRQLLIGSVHPVMMSTSVPDNGDSVESVLLSLYEERFAGVPITLTEVEDTEAIKLFLNSFFAVKIGFFNELKCLTDALNLNWEVIREGMLADGRIAHSHTQVPGPDGKRGFGGKCLPKDLENLVNIFNKIFNKIRPNNDEYWLISLATLMRNRHDRRLQEGDEA